MIIIEDYALRYIGDNHHPLWEIFSNIPAETTEDFEHCSIAGCWFNDV